MRNYALTGREYGGVYSLYCKGHTPDPPTSSMQSMLGVHLPPRDCCLELVPPPPSRNPRSAPELVIRKSFYLLIQLYGLSYLQDFMFKTLFYKYITYKSSGDMFKFSVIAICTDLAPYRQ